jgi:hypothetical protein
MKINKTISFIFAYFIISLAVSTQAPSALYGISNQPTFGGKKKISHAASQDSSLTLVGRWPYGSCKAVFVKDEYAYIGNGAVMTILDISDPASPKKVGEIETPGIVKDIYVWRHYAYIANFREGLRVIDVSDPSAPVEVDHEPIWCIRRLTGLRSMLYASNAMVVLLINVSAPKGPILTETIKTEDLPWDIDVFIDTASTKYLCVADRGGGLRIYDVTRTNSIAEIGAIDTPGEARDVFISGNYAYVVAYSSLYIIDLSNPSEPKILGSYDTRYQFCNIFVSEGSAYVTDELYGGLWIFDVSNPANPVIKGFYHPGHGCSEGLTVNGRYVYVAHGSAGLQILDVSALDAPQYVSSYQTGSYLTSIDVLGDYAYVLGGSSLILFDVRNPAYPAYHASILIGDVGFVSDIDVSNNFAYIAGYSGLWIVDVSVPDSPSVAGFFRTDYPGWSVCVIDQYVYVGHYNGFIVIDVSNKSDPRQVLFHETEDKVLKFCIAENYAYAAVSRAGLQIFDISALDHPVIIGRYEITHAGLSGVYFSKTYAYVAASRDGLRIIDVSQPEFPVEVSSYNKGFFHADAVHVSDNIAYITDGINGLRIIDVSLPENLKEITRFGTGDYAQDVFVSGNLIYLICSDAGLHILRNELADESDHIPAHISLMQNYPNPFNAWTSIRFELAVPSRVSLRIFDIKGREIETLIDNVLYNTGAHEIEWSVGRLPSGVYLYRLRAGDYCETKKLILLR